jgi:ribosome-binding protein aMBF1 (putative translation factor)
MIGKSNNLERLNQDSKKDDTWLKEAIWRQENRSWLERSAQIAFQVLEALSKQKRTQKDLAESMGVSPQFVNKIVKGSENMTLETISKLEKALNIQLIDIKGFECLSADAVVQNNTENDTKEV